MNDYPAQQRVADQLKAWVKPRPPHERRIAYNAIVNFERAGWYPTAFYEVLPLTVVMDERGVIYAGLPKDVVATVEQVIADYIAAVDAAFVHEAPDLSFAVLLSLDRYRLASVLVPQPFF